MEKIYAKGMTHREYHRQLYHSRNGTGLCVSCGKPRGDSKSKRQCTPCRARDQARERVLRQRPFEENATAKAYLRHKRKGYVARIKELQKRVTEIDLALGVSLKAEGGSDENATTHPV